MESLEALRDLLVPSILGNVIHDHGINYAKLREQSPNAKLNKVDISGVSNGAILIKLDKYEQPGSLFNDHRGQRQRCDYVLFTMFNGRGFALFIEIKSLKIKKAEYIRQFKGAECVIDYCHSALKRFHDHDQLLNNFEKRFVVFYKPRIAKKRTRHIKPSNGKNRENALLYPDPFKPPLKSLLAL